MKLKYEAILDHYLTELYRAAYEAWLRDNNTPFTERSDWLVQNGFAYPTDGLTSKSARLSVLCCPENDITERCRKTHGISIAQKSAVSQARVRVCLTSTLFEF